MKHTGNVILACALVSQSLSLSVRAQNDFRFRNITSENGMPSDLVVHIAQDSLGFVWLNHYSGLTRFDGYDFKSYVSSEDTLHSPTSGTVGETVVDHWGNLWVFPQAKSNGKFLLSRHDRSTDSFVRYRIDLKGAEATGLVADKNDRNLIWLGTHGNGLCSYNFETGFTRFFTQPHADSTTNSRLNWVNGMWDRGHDVVIATRQGLWRLDKLTGKIVRPACDPADTILFYRSSFFALIPDSRSGSARLTALNWGDHENKLMTDNLLIAVDSTLAIQRRLVLPHRFFYEYSMNDSGAFWIRDKQGIQLWDPVTRASIPVRHNPADPSSMLSNNVMRFSLDKTKNLWVPSSKGVSILPRRNLMFQNISLPNLTGAGLYRTPEEDFILVAQNAVRKRKGNLRIIDVLIAPAGAGHIDPSSFRTILSLEVDAIGVLFQGRERLWLTTGAPELILGYKLDPRTQMPQKEDVITLRLDNRNPNALHGIFIVDLWEDEAGNLWVPSKYGNLSWVNMKLKYGTPGSVITFSHDPNDTTSISNNNVWQIFPARNGGLWILTDTGIDLLHNRMNPGRNEKFEHVFSLKPPAGFAELDDGTLIVGSYKGVYTGTKSGDRYKFEVIKGLEDNEVSDIKVDDQGRLWIVNYQGAVCYDMKDQAIVRFTKGEGLLHSQLNGGVMAAKKTRDGRIVLFDNDGVTAFEPSGFKPDRHELVPVLTQLWINNQMVNGTAPIDEDEFKVQADITVLDELRIDYKHNNFSIAFAATEMIAPERTRYKYKLEGYDPDWIETGAKGRIATYTNLDPGRYTLVVRARNHHGIWSEAERRLNVVILPPPWKTWWAYTGYAMIAGVMFWSGRRSIIQRERLKADFKLEHVELEKAREVDKLKSSFFANISHEFRTPLTLIQGPVQDLLEKAGADKKTRDKLKLIQRNSELLLKLINQLLDLARLESGSLKVENTKGELTGFIRAVVSAFRSHAEQKDVRLGVEVQTIPIYASFDKDKLEAILINLVNNAIKFTPPGGRVIVRAQLEGENEFHIEVQDNGIGIAAEYHEKIFERFQQVSENHKEVGTGIGLALVKELVQLLGGAIRLKSMLGEGSLFVVTLPIETISEEDSIPVRTRDVHLADPGQAAAGISNIEYRTPNDEVDSSKAKVLVVEDNTDLRSFIIESLGDEFNFLEAADGMQGLELASAEVPDLIVSDVMMPEMDGIAMTAKLKADVRTNHIPLILLTAKSTEDSKLHGLRSGADDYLTKPFNKRELLLKVRNGISRQYRLREKLRADLMSTAPRVQVLSADEQFLETVKAGIVGRLGDEQLSVESLAEDIGMSRVQLYRKISALTGMSVNELIRKLRLQRAGQLLAQKWGPVGQVAYEVGFSNLSYFSKVFKEEFGVLPSEYEKA